MDSQKWRAVLEQGKMLQTQGEYAGAERLFRELAARGDTTREQKVQILDMLARFLHERHRETEAVQLLESAVELARVELSWQEPLRAGVMQNLARLYLLTGRYEACLSLGQEVLAGVEQALGTDHAETARAMQNLAAAHYELKHWDRAESLLLRAKGIWEAQAVPLPELGVCYNNLGRINEERGLYARGIAWHRQAVALRRRLLGDHPDTAFSLGNLGVALASDGQWSEAARTLEESLACYARCGRDTGFEVEGYRRNLELCRQAVAAGDRAVVRTAPAAGSQSDSATIDLAALQSLARLLPYDDAEPADVASGQQEDSVRSAEAERRALLQEIVEHEWRMFQATPNESGPTACQKNQQAFLLMRHMTHIVHDVSFLRSYAEDLRKGELEGRNFMVEKYARMMNKLPPLQETPLLDEITAQESLFLQEAARQYPRFFRAVPGTEFAAYLRCELESLSLRSLELYAAELRQARRQGKNFAQIRYAFLQRRLEDSATVA